MNTNIQKQVSNTPIFILIITVSLWIHDLVDRHLQNTST